MTDALALAKAAARVRALAARAGCDPALGRGLSAHVLARNPPGAVVAGFWPLPGEVDVRPLLHGFHEQGRAVALPVTPRRGDALTFRLWAPGAALVPGRFGTAHPEAPEAAPDLILVPLLAFDRRGGRLGYGAGYYDRTLAGLPNARTIGCAFAAQEVDEVPAGPYDRRLDLVATEAGIIDCRSDA